MRREWADNRQIRSFLRFVSSYEVLSQLPSRRSIKADIELIRPEDINRAYERVVNKNVRYRFVIDMASLKAPA